MDLFENLNDKFAEFWTPGRQKDDRTKLKVPKGNKFRCKSDSCSPFPDNFFDTTTRRCTERNENMFISRRQEKSPSRTPLQTLNKSFEVANCSIPKPASNVCVGKHNSETKSSFDIPLGADVIKPEFISCNLPFGSSSTVPRSVQSLKNAPVSSKINKRKKFIVFDENHSATLEKKHELNSPSIDLTPHRPMHLIDKYTDENSREELLLLSYQSKKKENLSNCDTSRNTPLLGFQNKRSDRKMISSPLNVGEIESLPNTEYIGAPFWGEDEGSIEEMFSLNDIIRSANIWDIKENFNCQSCSEWCGFLPQSPPELQLMQEPVFHMDLEPVTVEIPWDEI